MPDELIIPRSGNDPIRGVYSPCVHQIASALGKVTIRRASYVEPTEELSDATQERIWVQLSGQIPGTMQEAYDQLFPAGKWWADCAPVGGPVLGPFDNRDTALAEESKWLHDNNIPTVVALHKIQVEPAASPVLTEDDLDRPHFTAPSEMHDEYNERQKDTG